MIKDHGYDLTSLNEMYPYEFELHTLLILEHNEKLKNLKNGKPF